MTKQIKKRNGDIVEFDSARIFRAIEKSFLSVKKNISITVIESVKNLVISKINDKDDIDVEYIQDTVEKCLIQSGHSDVAKSFIIYRNEHKKERQKKVLENIKSKKLVILNNYGKQVIYNPLLVKLKIDNLAKGLNHINIHDLLDTINRNIYPKIKQSDIKKIMLNSCRDRIESHYDYCTMSARIVLDNLYKDNLKLSSDNDDFKERYQKGFMAYLTKGISQEMINKKLIKFDIKKIMDCINPDADKLFTYLGIQMIYDRYLLRDRSTQDVYELPQWFFMRVAMGLCLKEPEPTEWAIKFYEELSQMRIMSSTPTLFNSGTNFSQMSSCYLNTVSDDLSGIFKVFGDNAQLSKWAGGIGTDWTNVRASNSMIKGTNGKSQGVIPFIKIFNDVAVAVNQCFHPDTQVITSVNAKPIKDVVKGDLVLTDVGEYKSVLEVKEYEDSHDVVSIRSKYSLSPTKVSDSHPMYAVVSTSKSEPLAKINEKLEKKKIAPIWITAKGLKKDDLICTPIPKDYKNINDLSDDDLYFYGIVLGDGTVSYNDKNKTVECKVYLNTTTKLHLIDSIKKYLNKKNVEYIINEKGDSIYFSTGVNGINYKKMDFLYKYKMYDDKKKKYIHDSILHLPPERCLHVIKGLLFTDGCVSNENELTFTNTSDSIAYGIKYMLLKNRIPCRGNWRTRTRKADGERFKKDCITRVCEIRIPKAPVIAKALGIEPVTKFNWIDFQDKIWCRVTEHKTTDYNGVVYDLIIDGRENYTTDLGLAHNGGKRKGAMCAYIEIWHDDFEQFLELKKNTGDERRRAHDINTACWIPDLFMERVKNNGNWTFFCPSYVKDLHNSYGIEFNQKYENYEKIDTIPKRTVKAVDLWRKMITMLYETGHPWLTFKDSINVRNPQDHDGVVNSSNLCTEITLNTSPTETAVCNLASINLSKFVISDGMWKPTNRFHLFRLMQSVSIAIRMLDNVIDCNYYPTKESEKGSKNSRAIGLGQMGFQDALYKLGIPFDSEEAIEFADKSTESISYFSILASSELAAERGKYPSYDGSQWDRGLMPANTIKFMNRTRSEDVKMDAELGMDWDHVINKVKANGVRNSNMLAIAPTASISNITGVYPCTEPAYKNMYMKENLSGNFIVINRHLIDCLQGIGKWTPEILNKIKINNGSIQNITEIPENIRNIYKEVFEIAPEWIIKAASRRQKWIDQACSTNIFTVTTSGKYLSDIYMMAWEYGLKTTYYLRTLGASQVEKSNVNIIDNSGECEACQ
jgi:ribonucleoside-diphosphate reductase alpha chain